MDLTQSGSFSLGEHLSVQHACRRHVKSLASLVRTWKEPAGARLPPVAACQSRPGVGVAWRWSPPGRHLARLSAASGGAVAHVGPVKGPGRTLGAGEGHVGEVEDDAGDPKQDRGSSEQRPVHGGGPFAGSSGTGEPATWDQHRQQVWGKTGPTLGHSPGQTVRSARLTSDYEFRWTLLGRIGRDRLRVSEPDDGTDQSGPRRHGPVTAQVIPS